MSNIAKILQDMEGVDYHMDDILVHARTHEEHHRERLQKVLLCLQESGLTFNAEKCQRTEVKFLGQIIDDNGIRPDPGKIAAIQNVSEPKCVSDVHRFLGMTNQISKFLPGLADKTQPLREPQKKAFTSVKAAMCHSPVLAMFDPNQETILSADTSSFSLGLCYTNDKTMGPRDQ